MNRNNNVPRSLANHGEWQAKYINQLMSDRSYAMAKIPIERFLREIVANGAFYLRVRRERLPEILKSGRILSLMETGEGTTFGGSKTRTEVVESLFGCKSASMQASDYPKYGYISTPDPKMELMANDELTYHYGNAVFKLDKELMLSRTTMTVGTSVDFGVFRTMVPTRVDRILASCLPGPHNRSLSSPDTFKLGMQHYYLLASAIMEGRINSKNYFRLNALLGDMAPTFECFELQFHGPLRLGTEVREVLVYPDDDLPYITEQQAAYQAAGIPFTIHNLF